MISTHQYYSGNQIEKNGMCGVLLLLLFTAIELSPGGSSPYTSRQIRINTHKRNNKKHSTNKTQ